MSNASSSSAPEMPAPAADEDGLSLRCQFPPVASVSQSLPAPHHRAISLSPQGEAMRQGKFHVSAHAVLTRNKSSLALHPHAPTPSMGYEDMVFANRLTRPMRDREDGLVVHTLEVNKALGVRVVDLEDMVENLEGTMTDLGQELESVNLKLRVQYLDIGTLNGNVAALETANRVHDNDKVVLQSKVASLEDNKVVLQSKVASLEDNKVVLQSKVASLEDAVRDLAYTLQTVRDELIAFKAQKGWLKMLWEKLLDCDLPELLRSSEVYGRRVYGQIMVNVSSEIGKGAVEAGRGRQPDLEPGGYEYIVA
eukprot:gene5319-18566_t